MSTSVETMVFTTLRSLVSDRCYPVTFPQQAGVALPVWTQGPAIRFTIISQANEPTIEGTDDESTDDTRVQIDIVAMNYALVQGMRALVIAAMQNTDPPSTREEGGFVTFDEPTRTYRASLDFFVSASSPAGSP